MSLSHSPALAPGAPGGTPALAAPGPGGAGADAPRIPLGAVGDQSRAGHTPGFGAAGRAQCEPRGCSAKGASASARHCSLLPWPWGKGRRCLLSGLGQPATMVKNPAINSHVKWKNGRAIWRVKC
ncbi:hypothetical protein Nmel_015845 [Mimus melanotis]